jgi:hypothetical protein
VLWHSGRELCKGQAGCSYVRRRQQPQTDRRYGVCRFLKGTDLSAITFDNYRPTTDQFLIVVRNVGDGG